ncbi:MAG: hypothetical protein ACFCD0_11155 [Gemmataceae bacterium]
MSNLASLADVYESLKTLGYDAVLKDQSVAVKVGGLEKPFPAVITYNESRQHFQINCMLAVLGDVAEENVTNFAVAALDANTRIAPFAYGLISEADDPGADEVEKWPIVLTHSIPVGDFSQGELDSAMKSLVAALMDSQTLLDVFQA